MHAVNPPLTPYILLFLSLDRLGAATIVRMEEIPDKNEKIPENLQPVFAYLLTEQTEAEGSLQDLGDPGRNAEARERAWRAYQKRTAPGDSMTKEAFWGSFRDSLIVRTSRAGARRRRSLDLIANLRRGEFDPLIAYFERAVTDIEQDIQGMHKDRRYAKEVEALTEAVAGLNFLLRILREAKGGV